MSKSALNELCQRQKWPSPVYSTTKVGPDHTPVFRATVTVNGAAFASESVAQSSKGAQAEAARVALLQLSAGAAQAPPPPLETQVQDMYNNMYKNLLQERAQRGGDVLPVYETRVLGQGPSFISTVALEGYVFSGLEAKSKKVAEMSAAKAAYTSLTEEPVLPSPNVGSAQPSMPSKQKGIYMGSSSGTKTQEPLPLLILLDHLHQHILNELHASREKGDQPFIANPVPDSPFPGDRGQKRRMAPENNSNGHKHSKSELPSIVTTTTPVLENV